MTTAQPDAMQRKEVADVRFPDVNFALVSTLSVFLSSASVVVLQLHEG